MNGLSKNTKFDSARKLRGILIIHPEDGEFFPETNKNSRKKLEVPVEAAMHCKKITKKHSEFQETEAKSGEFNKIPKTMHTCIVETHESTRKRLESSLPERS